MNRHDEMKNVNPVDGVAIIGMAGRFPGASTVSKFWRNLCLGVEAIRSFSREEMIEAGVSPESLADPDYVNACGYLEEADGFDAAFFGYNPREVEWMDPQHRLFLECAWAALEDAGYGPDKLEVRCGVFGGVA